MISLHDLADLRRQLSGSDVLSVYIAAEEHDPTERSSWRSRLDAELDRLEESTAGASREALAAARAHLTAELRPHRGFLRGRGWVAFVTADRVWFCSEVPAPMPDLVRWRDAPVLGPYLRALKQNRPAVLVLIDSRRARVLRYQGGELTEDVDHRADEFIDDLTDRNMSKRAATSSGVRGETATDTADRILRLETERLVKYVAREVRLAGSEALVVLGGPTTAVSALQNALELEAGDRLLIEPTLRLAMSPADIRPVLETAVSALTGRLQLALVRAVLDDAGPGGMAVLGLHETARACALGQVELLLVTPRFLGTDEDAAESLIAQALEHAASVELLSDEAAVLLDASGGTGARLRYAGRHAVIEGVTLA